MRIKIVFKLLDTSLELPEDYHVYLQHLIYQILSFPNKKNLDLKDYELITFSNLMTEGHLIMEKQNITSKNELSIFVNSYKEKLLNPLFDDNFKKTNFIFDHHKVTIVDVQVIEKPTITNSMKVKLISPVLAYENQKGDEMFDRIFYGVGSVEFEKIINERFKKKYQIISSIVESCPIHLKVIEKSIKKNIKLKNEQVISFFAAFEINGKEEYLSFLYEVGLGMKTAKGFGMFEIIEN